MRAFEDELVIGIGRGRLAACRRLRNGDDETA
jgi:hypothetical protein